MDNINPQLKTYIAKQKQLADDARKKTKEIASENRKRQLIDAGLFTKVFDPEKKAVKSEEYPFLYYDKDTKNCIAYKKVATELSDEEYQEFLKYYKPSSKFVSVENEKSKNKINESTSNSAAFGFALLLIIASIICTCFGLFFMIAGITIGFIIISYCLLSDKINKLNKKIDDNNVPPSDNIHTKD